MGAGHLGPHSVVSGLSSITMACSALLIPAAGDVVIYYDLGGTQVLAAATGVSVAPLPAPPAGAPALSLITREVLSTDPTGADLVGPKGVPRR